MRCCARHIMQLQISDDDSQRLKEGSITAEQHQISQLTEEDMETHSQCGARGVGDNVDT